MSGISHDSIISQLGWFCFKMCFFKTVHGKTKQTNKPNTATMIQPGRERGMDEVKPTTKQ